MNSRALPKEEQLVSDPPLRGVFLLIVHLDDLHGDNFSSITRYSPVLIVRSLRDVNTYDLHRPVATCG